MAENLTNTGEMSVDVLLDSSVFSSAHNTNGTSFFNFLEIGPLKTSVTAKCAEPVWHSSSTSSSKVTLIFDMDNIASDADKKMIAVANSVGRVVDDYEQKKVAAALPLEMNFIMNGRLYHVPDMYAAFNSSGGAYLTLYSNWCDYAALRTWEGEQSITVHAQELDPVAKSEAKDVVLVFSTKADGKDQVLTCTFDRYLLTGSPIDFVDEFNILLAKKRVTDMGTWNDSKSHAIPNYGGGWKTDIRTLVDHYTMSTPEQVMNYHFVLSLDPKKDLALTAASIVTDIKESHLGESDYVNVTTLTNDMDTDQTLKSSDFAHTYTDTFVYTYAQNQTMSRKMTVKQTVEGYESFWLPVGVKEKVEISMEYNLQFSFTETWAWTTTDTRVYTISGQTLKVPAKSSVSMFTDWYRAKITGTLTCYNPISSEMVASHVGVLKNNQVDNFVTPINLKVAKAMLQMKSLKDKAPINGVDTDGLWLTTVYNFNTQTGVVGNYRVAQIPYVAPTATPELMSGTAVSTAGGK